ncbi:MAG: hypothetical protein QMB52_14805 [Propionivibrio sp.]
MPLPASLVASIVSAVIETVSQTSTVSTAQYDTYLVKRTLPPEVKVGFMLPPPGDGTIIISGHVLQLSPVAQFRNQQNLIVMPMAIQKSSDVVYLNDTFGSVHRIWLISQAEAESLKKN